MNERIKELRKELGLTLKKFGERVGISEGAVSNIEKGNRNVTDQMFKSICREFNVNPDWLRTGEGDKFNLPEDETAAIVSELLEETTPFYDHIINIVKTYRDLDDASQKVLDNFILQLYKNSQNEKED